jgi:hypothetical protein
VIANPSSAGVPLAEGKRVRAKLRKAQAR